MTYRFYILFLFDFDKVYNVFVFQNTQNNVHLNDV